MEGDNNNNNIEKNDAPEQGEENEPHIEADRDNSVIIQDEDNLDGDEPAPPEMAAQFPTFTTEHSGTHGIMMLLNALLNRRHNVAPDSNPQANTEADDAAQNGPPIADASQGRFRTLPMRRNLDDNEMYDESHPSFPYVLNWNRTTLGYRDAEPDASVCIDEASTIAYINEVLEKAETEEKNYIDIVHVDLSHLTAFSSLNPYIRTLRGLHLINCNLSVLPQDIGTLTELRSLNFEHNALERLPEDICLLPHLARLDVSHNKLIELPRRMHLFSQLYILLVSFNPIRSFPENLRLIAKGSYLFVFEAENCGLSYEEMRDTESKTEIHWPLTLADMCCQSVIVNSVDWQHASLPVDVQEKLAGGRSVKCDWCNGGIFGKMAVHKLTRLEINEFPVVLEGYFCTLPCYLSHERKLEDARRTRIEQGEQGPHDRTNPKQGDTVNRAIAANLCTMSETGERFTPHDRMYRCYTCKFEPAGPAGACETCVRLCHAGHNVMELIPRGNWYCDCGLGTFGVHCTCYEKLY